MNLTNVLIPTWAKWLAALLVVAALAGAVGYMVHTYNASLQTRFEEGFKAGKAACEALQAQAHAKATGQVIDAARADMAVAAALGAVQEQRRTGIDNHFDHLHNALAAAQAKGSPDEKRPVAGSVCVLPAERVRIWQAANLGGASGDTAGSSTAARQSDGSTAPVARVAQRGVARLRSEPLADGTPVPPVGGAALRPAATPAGAASGVQPVASTVASHPADVWRGN